MIISYKRSVTICNASVDLLRPRNQELSPIEAQLWQICCQNFQIFVTMATLIGLIGYRGNRSWPGVSLNDTIKLADPEYPLFGAKSLYVSLTMPKL